MTEKEKLIDSIVEILEVSNYSCKLRYIGANDRIHICQVFDHKKYSRENLLLYKKQFIYSKNIFLKEEHYKRLNARNNLQELYNSRFYINHRYKNLGFNFTRKQSVECFCKFVDRLGLSYLLFKEEHLQYIR